MSLHMNFSALVKKTMLKMSLAVIRSAVGVVTSPGKLIRFNPTVSRVQFFHISAVAFQPQLSRR